MIEEKQIHPPRWAERFLEWYCRPELLEDLQGDLNEYFERNCKVIGTRRARIIYVLDVFKFVRSYTVRKPKIVNSIISWIMLGSYIKTSGRNLVRNKLFSTINITGLAVSMSVGLLLIGVLSDVLSYDQFHVNHDRIYRVVSEYEYLGRRDNSPMATTSLKAGKLIQETFSLPEAVAILRSEFEGDVKYNEKTIPLKGFWANQGLFDVFSFALIKGNPQTALRDAFSVVLTETAARKVFGDEDPLGKSVVFKDNQYTITGILKDVPKFSHIRFEMLGSLSTREITEKDSKDEMKWDNIWSTWVYLLLPEGSDQGSLSESLSKLSATEDKTVKNTHVALWLQPMDGIMISKDFNNQIGHVMGISTLWIFGGLAFVVILSACFNYTNLSIARSLRRTREVGIRKVIGALKGHVRGQFLVEAVIISLSSLVIALLIYVLAKPYFLSIEPDLKELYQLDLTPLNLLYFVLFGILLGASAGFFPALFFSRVNAIQVLKDATNLRLSRKLTARKVLIVLQYCISIILISSTIVVYTQYKHYMAFDLGFTTENIINIPLRENKAELLKKDIGELPEVVGISQSAMVTSVGNYWSTDVKNPLIPNDSTFISYNMVDEFYFPLHDHKLIAGRNFIAKPGKGEESEIIVNELLLLCER